MNSTFYHIGKPDHQKKRFCGSAHVNKWEVSQGKWKPRRGGKLINAATSARHLSPLTHGPNLPQGRAARQSPAQPPLRTEGGNCRSRHPTPGQGHTLVKNVESERSGPRHRSSPGAAGRGRPCHGRRAAAAERPHPQSCSSSPCHKMAAAVPPGAARAHVAIGWLRTPDPARRALCYADWPTP